MTVLTLRLRKRPHWAAWEHDERIVEHYTPEIQKALSRVTGIRDAVAMALDAWRPLPIGKHSAPGYEPEAQTGGTGGATTERNLAKADTSANQEIRSMARQVAAQAVESNVIFDQAMLNRILASVYGDAYLVGTHAAANFAGPNGGAVAFLSGLEKETNWDTWEPGNPEAALKAAQGGLAQLLDARGTVIKGIHGTTLDQLGDVIAEGLEKGESTQAIYLGVRGIVDNPVRATMIARTETARAVVSAAFDTYREAGVAEWIWLAFPGACVICLENAAGGPYRIDEGPPMPAHPQCR